MRRKAPLSVDPKLAKVQRATLKVIIVTIIINLLLFTAPMMEPAGSVNYEDEGGANRIDFHEEAGNMTPVAGAVYWFGDLTCHQYSSRSFFINDNVMPVCARDVGIYLGLTLGALLYFFYPRRFSFAWLVVLIVPLGIDGTVQLFTPYVSNNITRVATGLMYGSIIMVFILQAIYDIAEVRLKEFGLQRKLRRRYGHLLPKWMLPQPYSHGGPPPGKYSPPPRQQGRRAPRKTSDRPRMKKPPAKKGRK